MQLTYRLLLLTFFSALFIPLWSQVSIKGRIMDSETKETIIGAWVILADSGSGTITDYEGRFELQTTQSPPIRMKISFLGYRSSNFTYYGGAGEIQIYLVPDWGSNMTDMVISASKAKEPNLEAPVSIQRLGALDLAYAPTHDTYAYLSHIKEAQMITSGRTFRSINTRGFAGVQNWRFLQLKDGMDQVVPGLGYAFSMLAGQSELDLHSVELAPGTGSPLYGPHAFNGLLHFRTKNPFDHEGVSFMLGSGASQQEAGGAHPFLNAGFRIAKAFNEKWAFKFHASYLDAVDWAADEQGMRTRSIEEVNAEELLPSISGLPEFDKVNSYADNSQEEIDLLGNGETTLVNRTGIAEKDLVDYNTDVLQLNGAIHYRPNNGMEISYDATYTEGDAILRQANLFPLVNMRVHSHKVELNSNLLKIKAYLTQFDANNSYNGLIAAEFIQNGLKPSNIWSRDYQLAYRGQVPGIAGGNHVRAREFADWGMPTADTELFSNLRSLTTENPEVLFLGSKFINKSNLIHAEGSYDLTEQVNGWELLIGASARRYQLYSAGSFFNDGVLGFWEPIPILEFGSFIQAGADLADEHIRLVGILRYDKNQNFQGRISPRASAVFSLGGNKTHNLRLSIQSGYRNPSGQESYARINSPGGIILGGVEANIDNYWEYDSGGRLITGKEIWGNLHTLPSYQNYLENGLEASQLETQQVEFLRQEQIISVEAGYKALMNDQFFLDLNVYNNIYNNLVSRVSVYASQLDEILSVYTNIPETISSTGASAGLSFKTAEGLKISGNYTFATYDAEEAQANNPGFLPAFNMPQHQTNLQIQHLNIYKGVGFGVVHHWSDSYVWESDFGVGKIDAYQTWDVAIHYEVPESPFRIKVGATNLLNKEYQTIYGGPFVGRQYFLKVVFE